MILDRPPNDPFLRKKEPFTSSFPLDEEAGVSEEAGILLTQGARICGNGKACRGEELLCHRSTFRLTGGRKREEAVYEVKGM